MTSIFNTYKQKDTRKNLRNEMSKPELKLWYYIRNNQLGSKFRRQYSIGNYIVDFYCASKKVAIEIDGDTHFNDKSHNYDEIRTKYITSFGIKVLRFTNIEVMRNIDEVVNNIREHIK